MSKKRNTDKHLTTDTDSKHEPGKTKLLSVDNFADDISRVPVLVVVSGNLLDVGRMLPLFQTNLTVGRDSSSNLTLNDRLISRTHIEISEVKQHKDSYSILVKDLESTNGTFSKGKRITSEWLNPGETIEIGSETILLFRIESIKCINDRNVVLSMVAQDSLTGVYNRRAFDQLIIHIRDKFLNSNSPYSLLLIDIDHFKKINDRFGHPYGDRILKLFAETIANCLRAEDIVARLGGDEFAVIIPGLNADKAKELADRMLCVIRNLKTDEDKPLNMTISIGISDDCGAQLKTTELYRRADVALYQAKQKGRNTTCIFQNNISAF